MLKRRDIQLERKLPKDGVIAPIAIFFIIFGIHTCLIGPSLEAFNILSKYDKFVFFQSSWFVAGIPAIIYSLLKLKPLLQSTAADKFLYFLVPSIFLIMMGVGLVNLI